MYGWKFNHKEEFVMNLILEKYEDGDWFRMKNSRKTSFDKLKDRQFCKNCLKPFSQNTDRIKMDLHEKECILQTKLI